MSSDVRNEIRQLSRIQRRVVGALMEKAFTTPEQYPLTLKAATSACNQKNNRDPITDYSEDQVADALEQLQQLGLVAEVYTDGGRAPRYRHYMRHKFDFTETQFAVIAELLLRGRQQPGELRTRASRMVKIESQELLKADLQSLQEKGFLQANGPLERRGVDVDHTFYAPREGQILKAVSAERDESADDQPNDQGSTDSGLASVASTAGATTGERAASAAITQLSEQLRDVTAQLSSLQDIMESLQERLSRIERDLGI